MSYRRRHRALLFGLVAVLGLATSASAEPRWRALPATPVLPEAIAGGVAAVNGINIWYAVFGHGQPVILLHGGLANANYWGAQVPALVARTYRVIVMDSRGHGRSSRGEQPLSYHLMASDVLAFMDFLKLDKAAIVGWSDGAIIGLDIAINHPERLTRLFAFAGNSNPSGVKDASKNPVVQAYLARAEKEYAELSPTPDRYKSFLAEVTKMWATQPKFTAKQLKGITVPTWIVAGDRDEVIKHEHTLFMADQIPGAALSIQPGVSHFAFLQAPQQFNCSVLDFLDRNTQW